MLLTNIHSQSRHPSRITHLVLGALLTLLISGAAIGAGNILDHIPMIARFDAWLYEWINLGPHPDWLNRLVSPFNFNFLPWGGTFIPSFLYFVFLFGFGYIGLRHRAFLGWTILTLAIGILIDAILFKLTNAYVIRDRPFLHLANNLTDGAKAIWRNWPTYPSGHVRDTALYTTIFAGYAKELRWIFIAFTAWLGFTRVYLGAHYPTDVLAGWIIGYTVALVILFIVEPWQRHLLAPQTASEITY